MAGRGRIGRGALLAVALAGLPAAVGCGARHDRAEALVLVVVDTLRADRIFDPQVPRWRGAALAPWLARARVYDRAFASSPWTLPSFASIYTGHIPSRHGAGDVVRLGGEQGFTAVAGPLEGSAGTLSEHLRDAGYATGAIVGNAALAPDFGFAQGFDTYDYTPASPSRMLRADRVVERALAFVDGTAGPFFLVVHFFDPHMNYDPPPHHRGRFTRQVPSQRTLPVRARQRIARSPESVSQEDRRFIAAAYDEEVAFVDEQLARLLAGFEDRGLLERGLVVLTSDHGEELFEHDGFEHGHALWQEVVNVPLAFLGRDVVPGRDASPVSLVDLFPTLLEAGGVAPPEECDGVSLWSSLRAHRAPPARSLFIEGTLYGPEQKAVVEWPHKLVWRPDSQEIALFDLARDPREQRPIRDDPATSARLLERLRSETEAAAAARGDAPAADVTPETLDLLRQLGYADDAGP
ncbi:MAG: sulfatase [Myxococcota bacterium]